MSKDRDYLSFIKLARILANIIENDSDEKMVISMFMNSIFRLPSISTGMVSPEAAKLKPSKRTSEHFYGRTDSAKRLLKELRQNPERSDKALLLFVKSRCRVHKVTAFENNELKKYHRKNPNAHWRKAYADCNIILQQNENNNQKYVYKINGLVYNDIKKILSTYNIQRHTLISRCGAKVKWPEWKRIEKEN